MRPDSSADPTWVHDLSIDGRREHGLGPLVAVQDPATEQTIIEVASATADQVDEAARSASQAFAATSWATDGAGRAMALHQLADLIGARRDEFVHAIVREVGTPITLARTLQVGMAISALRAYAELADRDRTEGLPIEQGALPNGGLVAYRPVGVVAALTAYNYPLYLAAQKVGAALAAGCTAVLAPSPQTPLSTLMLGELAQRVLPAGVLSVAVSIANDTMYGLSANVYGPSHPECLGVAARIRAGYVTINGGGGVRADAPFGGMRASGIGRESGEWGVREYLEPQQIQWSLA
jgi:aldehyde dehydrogenase (NAD+)/betaine-aldehyde dehydrogenase